MNIANKLTVLRVILIPFFVVFLLIPELSFSINILNVPLNLWIAEFIFIVASLTDFLDGYLARKHDLITDFGKFMDPLADKLLVCSALICFTGMNILPSWMVLIIIAREFIISGFRLVASTKGVVIAASWWGKYKTTIQIIMIIFLILNFDTAIINTIEWILVYLSLALTIISLIDYLIKNKEIFVEGNTK